MSWFTRFRAPSSFGKSDERWLPWRRRQLLVVVTVADDRKHPDVLYRYTDAFSLVRSLRRRRSSCDLVNLQAAGSPRMQTAAFARTGSARSVSIGVGFNPTEERGRQ